MGVPAIIIIEELATTHQFERNCTNIHARIDTVQPFVGPCEPNVLAIAEKDEPDLGQARGNVLVCPGSSRELLAHACRSLARYSSWKERMLESIARRSGLPELLATAAEVLGNPFAVFSSDISVLAIAGDFTGDVRGTIWEHLGTGALDWSYYSPADQAIISRAASRATTPFSFSPAVDPNHTYLSSFVRLKGEVVASIGMVDVNAPISAGQVALFDEIARLLELFFAGNRLYRKLAQGGMLSELIHGSSIPAETISYWLAEHGLGNARHLLVATLRRELIGEEQSNLYPEFKTFEQRIGHAIIEPIDGDIVAILDADEAEERLKSAMAGLGLCCGLSRDFCNPARIAAHYRQARASVSEATSQSTVVRYPAIHRKQLLAALADSPEMVDSVDDTVLALWEGGERERELVRCLYQYLVCGGNLSAASRALFVHRNTLIYRLGVLEERMGIKLDGLGEDERLLLLTSCLMAMA